VEVFEEKIAWNWERKYRDTIEIRNNPNETEKKNSLDVIVNV
jgi:hypothetical protein